MTKPHPAAELFPTLPDVELQALADDIQANGLREPIVLLEGQVLDGWHRLKACRQAGVEPTFRELPADTDPISFVLSANLHRRHLSTSQRAMIAARVAQLNTCEARQRSTANLRRGQASPEVAKLPPRARSGESGRSRDAAAAQLGVSGRTVQDALTVCHQGSPELVKMVERGEVTATRAASIARDVPRREQADEVRFSRWRSRELADALARVLLSSSRWRTVDEIVAEIRHLPTACRGLGVAAKHVRRALTALQRRPPAERLVEVRRERGDTQYRLVSVALLSDEQQQLRHEALQLITALRGDADDDNRGRLDRLQQLVDALAIGANRDRIIFALEPAADTDRPRRHIMVGPFPKEKKRAEDPR